MGLKLFVLSDPAVFWTMLGSLIALLTFIGSISSYIYKKYNNNSKLKKELSILREENQSLNDKLDMKNKQLKIVASNKDEEQKDITRDDDMINWGELSFKLLMIILLCYIGYKLHRVHSAITT